jgi:ubiquinol-cytochrome c reductase cytochrome c subunit
MRKNLRARYLIPGAVVVGVSVAGMLGSAASAGPSTQSQSASASASAYATATATVAPGSAAASTPGSPISYSAPTSPAQIQAGLTLFSANCASCHGADAGGGQVAPSLQGLGAGTIDFWVSTGRMPLAAADIQATRKPSRFDATQRAEIVAFVTAQAPNYGIAIPTVDTTGTSISDGEAQFVLNCAACHTISGAGDALAAGAYAPSLHQATNTEVAEAMRTGPGNMPRFGPGQLSDQQVADVVAYVTGTLQHPDNAGGLGMGGIGPVAEGFIALLIGVGGMMLIAFWLGDRA